MRVEATQIFDLEIFELVGTLGLDERLDLRISAKLAGANLENCFGVFFASGTSGFLLTAFDALLLDLLKAKIFEIVA